MKKILTNTIGILSMMLFFQISAHAQQEFSMVTSASYLSLTDDYLLAFPLERKVDSKLGKASESRVKMALASSYDANVQENFGAYMNPYTQQLKVKSQKVVSYNKIQLTNMDTKEVVLKSKIEQSDNILDLSNLKSGKYRLIMTDSNNNIHTETFTIL